MRRCPKIAIFFLRGVLKRNGVRERNRYFAVIIASFNTGSTHLHRGKRKVGLKGNVFLNCSKMYVPPLLPSKLLKTTTRSFETAGSLTKIGRRRHTRNDRWHHVGKIVIRETSENYCHTCPKWKAAFDVLFSGQNTSTNWGNTSDEVTSSQAKKVGAYTLMTFCI